MKINGDQIKLYYRHESYDQPMCLESEEFQEDDWINAIAEKTIERCKHIVN